MSASHGPVLRRHRPLNARAMRTLERLVRRYNIGPVPSLREIESALWRAGEFADHGFGGYSPWRQGLLLPSNIEGWASTHLGWSFPCAEAVGLVRRVMHWPSGRIIDVGAGCGLWTKVLKREFSPSPREHSTKAGVETPATLLPSAKA